MRIVSASEARQKAVFYTVDIEDLFRRILAEAESGGLFLYSYADLQPSQLKALEDLGYGVSWRAGYGWQITW